MTPQQLDEIEKRWDGYLEKNEVERRFLFDQWWDKRDFWDMTKALREAWEALEQVSSDDRMSEAQITAAITEAQKERDEARAEVERLKAQVAGNGMLLTAISMIVGDRPGLVEAVLQLKAASDEMDEFAVAVGYGERPEGQSGVHRLSGEQLADCWKLRDRERDDALEEVERLKAEGDEARKWLEGICSEFEGAIAHADWRAAGSKGMSVPFTGDFASVVQLPGAINKMRWWVKVFRAVLNGEKP